MTILMENFPDLEILAMARSMILVNSTGDSCPSTFQRHMFLPEITWIQALEDRFQGLLSQLSCQPQASFQRYDTARHNY